MSPFGGYLLPFLAKSKQAAAPGVTIKVRAPDEKPEADDSSAASEAVAQALINAIHARDVKGVVSALQDAMDVIEPAADESSVEPHSYDAQNIKAGEQE